MFAIPWNFPFRKKDGSISTIGDEMGSGGGSAYTLPTASTSTKGGIKIGAGLTMDGEVLNNTNPTPATPYTLPTASGDVLGGVKVGTGLSIDENGVLSASGGGGGGGSLDIQYHTMNISVSNSTPPRIADSIPFSTIPGNAIILGYTFIQSENNPQERKSYIVSLNKTVSSNSWIIVIDTDDGTGQSGSGAFTVCYVVPTT